MSSITTEWVAVSPSMQRTWSVCSAGLAEMAIVEVVAPANAPVWMVPRLALPEMVMSTKEGDDGENTGRSCVKPSLLSL